MDRTVERLKTPKKCERFAAQHPELAQQARRRSIELLAAQHCEATAVAREVFQVIHAYEESHFLKHGKRKRANRLWHMIRKISITKVVEYAVMYRHDPTGYAALKEMGMKDLTFEAVVIRHPEAFSAEAIERSKQRLREWEK